VLEPLKAHSAALVEKWGCQLLEFNGQPDHVHLLLSLNPKVAPSVFVNNLKTVTSRYIRQEFAEERN
jgi:putative transposase